jgi:hypothetical protein
VDEEVRAPQAVSVPKMLVGKERALSATPVCIEGRKLEEIFLHAHAKGLFAG